MSTEQKQGHTPGPWTMKSPYMSRSGWSIETAEDDGYNIAHVIDINRSDENQANAHLIAAAPEMLAALKKAEQMIHSEYCGTSHNPFCEELERLIAKAEAR